MAWVIKLTLDSYGLVPMLSDIDVEVTSETVLLHLYKLSSRREVPEPHEEFLTLSQDTSPTQGDPGVVTREPKERHV